MVVAIENPKSFNKLVCTEFLFPIVFKFEYQRNLRLMNFRGLCRRPRMLQYRFFYLSLLNII